METPGCWKAMSSSALQTHRSNTEQWMDELELRPGGGMTQDPGATSVHSPSNPRHRFFYLQAATNRALTCTKFPPSAKSKSAAEAISTRNGCLPSEAKRDHHAQRLVALKRMPNHAFFVGIRLVLEPHVVTKLQVDMWNSLELSGWGM
jgi:hypothetical protein